MRRLIVLALTAATVAGCSGFPALDAAVSAEARHAPYPKLLPLSEVLASPEAPRATAETAPALEARAAALRARAARLWGTGNVDAAPATN